MDRRRRSSLAGSPLLIGAVTTLIVLVAVFLSYNANNGLPFVPTYNIKVELPEGAGLQPSNQVRIAGTRVGIVSSLSLQQSKRTGQVHAIADLKLEKGVEPLPANTRAIVQSVSAIGLKYLELERGSSSQTIKAGSTIPVSQTTEPVNIDELFNMFDQQTRTAIKQNTNNFGDGLAARGLGLNNTIHELRPLVNAAIPVLHNIASPSTDLRGFFKGLDRAASQAAPVAEAQAAYYSDLDTFFTAFARVTPQLEAATEGGPASLEQAIHSLPFQAPFIENATTFMHLLRPSAAILRTTAAPLGHAFQVGAVNLRAATALNSELAESSEALAAFAQNPIVTASFEDFTQTLELGNPLLAGFAPLQSYCNYVTLALRNVANLETENVGVGTLARAGVVLSPTGVNNEGYPSSAPANGPSEEHSGGPNSPLVDLKNNHVHVNNYPNVGAPGQRKVCEAGNENYITGQAVIGNPPASAVSNNREFTNRETNLFAEKYPASTLKALGVTKPKSKGTGK